MRFRGEHQQFQNISALRERFQRQGLPIISVDSKKRELIGNFKNAGAKWDRSPVRVNDHDFRSDASGVGLSKKERRCLTSNQFHTASEFSRHHRSTVNGALLVRVPLGRTT
jgi:hypothetical protein